jgi:nicotinamidase-related amidase
MKTIDPRRSVLVLVDYQQKLMPAIHEGEDVVSRAVLLADCARELGIPVVGTEQNPRGLGPNVEAIRARCQATIAKNHFDGCRDALLEALPQQPQRPIDIVVAGCEAHVCMMQTALGLMRAGYAVWVVGDASGSRSRVDRNVAFRRLRQAGAVIVTVEMVVFEWLQTCDHERFRSVLQLLKAPPG